MSFDNIIFEKDDRVAILTINRADRKNTLDKHTRLELLSVLDFLEGCSDIGALVVTGDGKDVFMSGDLDELSRKTPIELYEFLDTIAQKLYSRFEQLDIPVIAMINGTCMGAGLEIAIASDLRIAADSARFGLPEIHLGIMPGGGATQRLTNLIGPGKTKELLYIGEFIDAEEALKIGLINRMVSFTGLHKATMDLAHKIAAKGTLSLKMIKRSVNMRQEVGITPGLAFEALAAVTTWSSIDRQEGIEAFQSKREPCFHKKSHLEKA